MVTKKLSRKKANREMLLRNQVTSILLYERIKTTLAKAKVTKGIADRIINKAKDGTLGSRRYIHGYLLDDLAVKKLYDELVPRLKDRSSGYFRHYLLGNRIGDGARSVFLEIVDYKPVAKPTQTVAESEEKEPTTRLERRQAKKAERLTKDQVKSEVTTIVRKKGERRISNEK